MAAERHITDLTETQRDSLRKFYLEVYGEDLNPEPDHLFGGVPFGNLSVETPSDLVDLFSHRHLLAQLVTLLQTHPEQVNLNYWVAKRPRLVGLAEDFDYQATLVSPTPEYCGTVACIGGHIALLKGGAPYWSLRNNTSSKFVMFLGMVWRYDDLAFFIWRATYPAGNLALFAKGISDPNFIFRHYADVGETRLDVNHVASFLQEATENLPGET